MSDDEIIEVVQARRDGKRIQAQTKNITNNWTDVTSAPSWNFNDVDFRIAPEPRKPRDWLIHIPKKPINECVKVDIFPGSENHSRLPVYESECIRVREVIET